MGNRLWLVGAMMATLLLLASQLATAQKQKDPAPPPADKESAEWKRAQEGLKKAKPIPDPSHSAVPTTTPAGGLQGFDAKTGEAKATPRTTPAAAPGKGHAEGKSSVHPKNANGGKSE